MFIGTNNSTVKINRLIFCLTSFLNIAPTVFSVPSEHKALPLVNELDYHHVYYYVRSYQQQFFDIRINGDRSYFHQLLLMADVVNTLVVAIFFYTQLIFNPYLYFFYNLTPTQNAFYEMLLVRKTKIDLLFWPPSHGAKQVSRLTSTYIDQL